MLRLVYVNLRFLSMSAKHLAIRQSQSATRCSIYTKYETKDLQSLVGFRRICVSSGVLHNPSWRAHSAVLIMSKNIVIRLGLMGHHSQGQGFEVHVGCLLRGNVIDIILLYTLEDNPWLPPNLAYFCKV